MPSAQRCNTTLKPGGVVICFMWLAGSYWISRLGKSLPWGRASPELHTSIPLLGTRLKYIPTLIYPCILRADNLRRPLGPNCRPHSCLGVLKCKWSVKLPPSQSRSDQVLKQARYLIYMARVYFLSPSENENSPLISTFLFAASYGDSSYCIVW